MLPAVITRAMPHVHQRPVVGNRASGYRTAGAGLFRAGRAAPRTKDNFTRPAFAAARNILSNPTGSYLSYRLGTGND